VLKLNRSLKVAQNPQIVFGCLVLMAGVDFLREKYCWLVGSGGWCWFCV